MTKKPTKEISKNGATTVKPKRDLPKLNYYEEILLLYTSDEVNSGVPLSVVKERYTSIQTTKQQRYKAGLLFDKIFLYLNTAYGCEIIKEYKRKQANIQRFDRIYGMA